jgi:outer membrane murein-binding lipoprotein Lpp
MPASYDDALTELYRVPHSAFVTERKRLAGELKAAGDKEGAAKLTKITRPPVSAWAVNQLWWKNRRDFEAMLGTAERLREGDLGAASAHREAIAKLRARAAAILEGEGHAASEATLRRVATTLSAIAAVGGFDPDPPGRLTDDRDPPGFETMAVVAAAHKPAAAHKHHDAAEEREEREEREEHGKHGKRHKDEDDEDKKKKEQEKEKEETAAEARRREAAEEKRRREAEEALQRAEEAAARRKHEQTVARKKAERERVAAALRTSTGEVERLQRDVDKLRASIEAAEDRLARARAIEADLALKLEELEQELADG